jgi:hypothetical protein
MKCLIKIRTNHISKLRIACAPTDELAVMHSILQVVRNLPAGVSLTNDNKAEALLPGGTTAQ